MLLVFGLLLLALGLLSGAALVLAALGVLIAGSGLTLWVTFPLLSLVGFAFVAAQARPGLIGTASLVASALLLLMALVSVAVLVLGAAGLVAAVPNTAPLWYVLVVGGVIGSIGAASYGRGAGRL